MGDWDADLSPCNFATTHVLQKEAVVPPCNFATTHLTEFILHCICNFATPEMKDPFVTFQEEKFA